MKIAETAHKRSFTEFAENVVGRLNRRVRYVVEELDLTELSRKTLAAYIQHASSDSEQRGYEMGRKHQSGQMSSKGEGRKGYNRLKGIGTAAYKLAKEENISELSDELRKRYVSAAQKDRANSEKMARRIKDEPDSAAKLYRRAIKRRAGLAKA